MVRDSAGVRLVESLSPRYPNGLAFRIDEGPRLVIGSIDDPESILGRPWGASRLSDGRILIFDGQTQEILVFDAQGRRLGDWGGRGDGPGEFARASLLQRLPGDTVAVMDLVLARTTFLAPDGSVLRTQRNQFDFRTEGRMPAQSCCIPLGVTASGTSLWRYPRVWSRDGTQDHPITTTIVRSRPEGTDTLGEFASGTAGFWPGGVNPVVPEEYTPRLTVRLFQGFSMLALGAGETLGFETLDPSTGVLRMRARGRFPRRPVDEDLIAAWQAQTAGTESSEGSSDRLLSLPMSDSVSAFFDLLVSDDGEVWLREWNFPGGSNDSAFQVFSPEGEWLGRIVLPGPSIVLEVGADYLLRSTVGEYDEGYIEMWELKPW